MSKSTRTSGQLSYHPFLFRWEEEMACIKSVFVGHFTHIKCSDTICKCKSELGLSAQISIKRCAALSAASCVNYLGSDLTITSTLHTPTLLVVIPLASLSATSATLSDSDTVLLNSFASSVNFNWTTSRCAELLDVLIKRVQESLWSSAALSHGFFRTIVSAEVGGN